MLKNEKVKLRFYTITLLDALAGWIESHYSETHWLMKLLLLAWLQGQSNLPVQCDSCMTKEMSSSLIGLQKRLDSFRLFLDTPVGGYFIWQGVWVVNYHFISLVSIVLAWLIQLCLNFVALQESTCLLDNQGCAFYIRNWSGGSL